MERTGTYDGGFQQRVWIRSFSEDFVYVQEGVFGRFGAFGEGVDFGLVCYSCHK